MMSPITKGSAAHNAQVRLCSWVKPGFFIATPLWINTAFRIFEKRVFVNKIVFEKVLKYSWFLFTSYNQTNCISNFHRRYRMPAPIKSGLQGGATSSAGTYVRFSDQLTNSITDITRIIEQHKSMIDSIQEVALELTTSIGTLHNLTLGLLNDLCIAAFGFYGQRKQ